MFEVFNDMTHQYTRTCFEQLKDFIYRKQEAKFDWADEERAKISTVEELKALKEKDVEKKPILSKSMMTKREFQICPICERLVLYDGIKFNHCQYCGQKLDWE